MSRIARAIAQGYPHHIIQRGNNKADVFFDEDDRRQYLKFLIKYSEKWSSSVLAYCLMTNHCHLLIKPGAESSLSKMMQGLTLCYTQYVNRKYRRTGRLWESRYHSFIVDEETYLWAAARYIEQNPVRAGMVEVSEDYLFSSARAHVTGMRDDVLGEELFSSDRRDDYVTLLRSEVSKEDKEAMRNHARSGIPLGGEKFIGDMEQTLNRPFTRGPRGRPKRQE
jgi:putative transposase